MYTTGEIAKQCHVSIRTVQYYDKEKIISPSGVSAGGRRLYSEEDLEKFQRVCLYKKLGFSLKNIQNIIQFNQEQDILLELLNKQEHIVKQQIKELQTTKDKISVLVEEIKTQGNLTVSRYEELDQLLIKKKKHQKLDMITYLMTVSYGMFVLLGLVITSQIGGLYPILMLVIAGILLVCLIHYHSSNNAYLCPVCHHKFKISFLKDTFTFHNGKQGKYLKCPHCHQKNWIKETYRE